MEETKKIIASNLIKFRKNAKLTQLELAEKIKYSDKNISKWERGDAVPDVLVLKQLADIYGVTVNDFLDNSPNIPDETNNFKIKNRTLNKKQILITMLSSSLVWLVAITLYGIFEFLNIFDGHTWKCFIIAIPTCAIVALVFTSIWCTNMLNAVMVTALIWTTAVSLYVCIPVKEMWLVFILAIPLQILDILWFTFQKINKKDLKKHGKGTNL